jgi:hypothetical protein
MSKLEKWYNALQKQNENFRRVYQRPNNHTYFVCDFQVKPLVLNAHRQLTSYSDNVNGVYYKINKETITCPWVPLLPNYTIFTCCAKHYVKMRIEKDEAERLCFCWKDYGEDETFSRIVTEGRDFEMFSSLKSHLDVDRTYSVPFLLGFNNQSVCSWLQSFVLDKFPNIFAENHQKIKGAHRVEQTIRSAKRKHEQLVESLAAKETGIQAGVLVNQQGIHLTPLESQALVVMHNEFQNQHHNDNKL